jgi:hypothetical protein
LKTPVQKRPDPPAPRLLRHLWTVRNSSPDRSITADIYRNTYGLELCIHCGERPDNLLDSLCRERMSAARAQVVHCSSREDGAGMNTMNDERPFLSSSELEELRRLKRTLGDDVVVRIQEEVWRDHGPSDTRTEAAAGLWHAFLPALRDVLRH